MKRIILFLAIAAVAASSQAQPAKPDEFKVLVFTKTAGFRHSSIPDGVAALIRLGDRHGFGVDATEDARIFNSGMLDGYEVVVFLSTTGDILNSEQETALQRWVEAGHGLVGIHAAADTEYEWEWYGHAMGGYFKSHPHNQTAKIKVEDRSHPSTSHLDAEWERFDEWYNYRENPRENVNVLMTLDESSYEGGQMGDDHPISWYHNVGSGRVWYTGLGHTEESYTEEPFLQHVLGGILWAAGKAGVDMGDASVGAEGTFEKVILNDDALDPMELAVASDGRVFFIERAGAVCIWHPETGETTTAGYVPVRTTGENGMLGLALDPDFESNHWIYLLHTVPDGKPRQHLSRFFLDDSRLDPSSQKVLLEIPLTLGECCHSGGSLAFGPDGNLFVSVGDETNPFASDGFNPIDERKGRDIWDAQRSAANANDLRGKILRIRPLGDGTYAIPEGNLFPSDGSQGRPEIYVMGSRNPFRIALDSRTGWLLWGDVGPDAGAPNDTRGPAGHDEINLAKSPGNYGWPYFTGNNLVYHDFDYASLTPGPAFDPARPINDSPNNTGIRELPPAQPALIWYPYGPSVEFPQMEAGGRTAIAGGVYRHHPSHTAPGALPASYDGMFFFGDWQRNRLFAGRLEDDGSLPSFERIVPEMEILRPMDMAIGPDGRIYLIEWGTTYGGNNPDAKIIRLDYRPTALAARSATGPALAAASGPVANVSSGLHFLQPSPGALALPGSSVPYELALPGGVDPASVRVKARLESDGNVLAVAESAGVKGSIVLPDAEASDPSFVSRRWRISASYTDASGKEVSAISNLYPPTLEAVHAGLRQDASKEISYDAESGHTTSNLALAAGGWASYGHRSLARADSVAIHLSPMSDGVLEVRRDSVDGAVLASIPVDAARTREMMADTATVAAAYRIAYDDDNVYFVMDVIDDDVQTNREMAVLNEKVELYFDAGHEAGISYDDNDLRIEMPIGQGPDGATSPQVGRPDVTYAMAATPDGYRLEAIIPWTTLKTSPRDGATMGFEVNLTDVDEGEEDRMLAWASFRDVAWSEPRVFGNLQIGGESAQRRRGASVSATRLDAPISLDGELDARWLSIQPTPMRRHLSGGSSFGATQVRERVAAAIDAPAEPVDLYVHFQSDSERGRVVLERIEFILGD